MITLCQAAILIWMSKVNSLEKVRLLLPSGATFSDIALEIGLSRERVRQLAKKLGVIGHPRRRQQTETKSAPTLFRVYFHRRLKEILASQGYIYCYRCKLWLRDTKFTSSMKTAKSGRMCAQCNTSKSTQYYGLKKANRDTCSHPVWVKGGPGLETCSNCRKVRTIK